MAISHIPRSVGHNFAPEYQISAIPYCVQLNTSTPNRERIIVQKTTGKLAATDPSNDGNLVLAPGSGFTENDIKDNDGGTFTVNNLDNSFQEIYKVKLPKIAQWIQVKNPSGDHSLSIWFHPKGAANNSVMGKLNVGTSKTTDVYPLRFCSL